MLKFYGWWDKINQVDKAISIERNDHQTAK